MNVREIFSSEGPLARGLSGYQERAGQVAMAELVERNLEQGRHALIEAGTGVGKSLAYLIPLLRSGKKAVISTGTIALQEQLIHKDIPLVLDALESKARVALLKGRSHYLCKLKYERMRDERLLPPTRSMQQLWEWAARTTEGDRAELDFVPNAGEWEQLDADADECVGELCRHFRDCYFFEKRERAKLADVVVVNHALFFLDLASGGGLLPPYDVAVLDEAHQCERWATAALTATVSHATIGLMLRKMRRTYDLPSSFDAQFERDLEELRLVLARVGGERYPLAANEDAGLALDRLRGTLYGLENWLHANWDKALRRAPEHEGEAERRRDNAMRAILAHEVAIDRAQAGGQETIAWAERSESSGTHEVKVAPFEVADFLRTRLFERAESIVLTSATLACGTSFGFLKRSLGVTESDELIAASPFDFRAQARLYVAEPNVNPKALDFARRAAPLIEECLDRCAGRAFVLFTSYARLRELYTLLRDRIAYPVRIQGEMPRARLLEWFRRTQGAVLFATGTFWEGIDVVGEQLSCVIIDRLPFPSPSDPLVAARLAAIDATGGTSFEDYMVPAAIVRLKQGFGRLIRAESDRGLLALLDGRAEGTRYGRTIVNALPPAQRISRLADLEELFEPRPQRAAQT